MPFDYIRDDAKRRIVVVSIGTVTLAETLAIVDRQAREGAWSFSVLYDTRAAANTPTAADLHQLLLRVGALTARHGPRGRVALVVRDPALTKMGRRYASLGDLTAQHVRLFATLAEAEHWLDEDED